MHGVIDYFQIWNSLSHMLRKAETKNYFSFCSLLFFNHYYFSFPPSYLFMSLSLFTSSRWQMSKWYRNDLLQTIFFLFSSSCHFFPHVYIHLSETFVRFSNTSTQTLTIFFSFLRWNLLLRNRFLNALFYQRIFFTHNLRRKICENS